MDKRYIKLFTELAHTTEILAEQALELNTTSKDEKGIKAATTMREDYASLYDTMRADDFDPDSLTRKDYAKLLIGSIITVQQLEKKEEAIKKAIQGYKIDTIPKLERIVNECKTDEDSKALAKDLFQVKQEEKSND